MKIDKAKLKDAQARAKMTRNQLVEVAKINQKTIQRIYRGENLAPVTVGRIAEALNVDIDAIKEVENV